MVIIYFDKNIFWTIILCKILRQRLRNQAMSGKGETTGETGYKVAFRCRFGILL